MHHVQRCWRFAGACARAEGRNGKGYSGYDLAVFVIRNSIAVFIRKRDYAHVAGSGHRRSGGAGGSGAGKNKSYPCSAARQKIEEAAKLSLAEIGVTEAEIQVDMDIAEDSIISITELKVFLSDVQAGRERLIQEALEKKLGCPVTVELEGD